MRDTNIELNIWFFAQKSQFEQSIVNNSKYLMKRKWWNAKRIQREEVEQKAHTHTLYMSIERKKNKYQKNQKWCTIAASNKWCSHITLRMECVSHSLTHSDTTCSRRYYTYTQVIESHRLWQPFLLYFFSLHHHSIIRLCIDFFPFVRAEYVRWLVHWNIIEEEEESRREKKLKIPNQIVYFRKGDID